MISEAKKSPPMFVAIITLVIVVGTLVVSLGTWQIVSIKNSVRDTNCERVVAVRNDNRAMWLYLLEDAPDDQKTRDFVTELNKRLPVLECDAGVITEVD
jgi:hypothetical protein